LESTRVEKGVRIAFFMKRKDIERVLKHFSKIEMLLLKRGHFNQKKRKFFNQRGQILKESLVGSQKQF